MKLNMTSKILESVQSTNEDTRVKSYKVLKEENVIKEGLNTCPRCGKEIIGYPAVSRFDNETEICSDCGMDEAFENMAGYMTNPNTGEKMSLDDLRNQKRAKSMSDEDLEKVMNGTMDDYSYSTIKAKDDFDKKKAIEDRAGELRVAMDDGALADDEVEAVKKEVSELEDNLNESSNERSDLANEFDIFLKYYREGRNNHPVGASMYYPLVSKVYYQTNIVTSISEENIPNFIFFVDYVLNKTVGDNPTGEEVYDKIVHIFEVFENMGPERDDMDASEFVKYV